MNTKHKKGESFNVPIKQVRKVTPKHLSDFIKFPQNMKMIVHVARYAFICLIIYDLQNSKSVLLKCIERLMSPYRMEMSFHTYKIHIWTELVHVVHVLFCDCSQQACQQYRSCGQEI